MRSVTSRSCATLGGFIVVVFCVALAAAPARGAFVQGYVAVSDTFTPVGGGSDDATASSSDGSARSGTASFGGGSASFNLVPNAAVATVTGQSKPITFDNWNVFHWESLAEGYVRILDTFRVNGEIDGSVPFTVRIEARGTLSPNVDFETRYRAAFGGQQTVTATATIDVTYGKPGQLNEHHSDTIVGRTANDDAGLTASLGLIADASNRDFAFNVLVGGTGRRGGGFNFAGSAETQSASLSTADTYLDTSAIEIVVELPPGLSITSEDGYFVRQVTIPEPAILPMLGVVLTLGIGRRRRR